jgi:hypothetical protein
MPSRKKIAKKYDGIDMFTPKKQRTAGPRRPMDGPTAMAQDANCDGSHAYAYCLVRPAPIRRRIVG